MYVACQQVLYILPLGFVPIYFFQRVFKGFSKGLQRPFKDHLKVFYVYCFFFYIAVDDEKSLTLIVIIFKRNNCFHLLFRVN